MPGGVMTLESGARFWFEGQVWEVDCFLGDQVRLRRATTVRSVATAALLATATALDEQAGTPDSPAVVLPSVALASLTVQQRRELDRKVEQLQPLIGPVTDAADRADQIAAQARRIGVSVRTLRRRLHRLESHGPAGLIDARLLRETRRTVDPLWDAACLQVLASFVAESTPTRKTVITRT